MTKKELEQQIEVLLKENSELLYNNKGMGFIIEKFKDFIEYNLNFFKSGMGDLKNERNIGILATLNAIAKIYNKHIAYHKIEIVNINPELKVVRFPSMEEGTNDKENN